MDPGIWRIPLSPDVREVMVPSTLLPELMMEANRLIPHHRKTENKESADTRKRLEEEAYGVLVNMCYILLDRVGNINADTALFCTTWMPRIAWDRMYEIKQLCSPHNNLPYNSAVPRVHALPLFHNEDFKPRDFMHPHFVPSIDQQDRKDECCVQFNRSFALIFDTRYKKLLRYLKSFSITDKKAKPNIDHFMETERIIHGVKPHRVKRLELKPTIVYKAPKQIIETKPSDPAKFRHLYITGKDIVPKSKTSMPMSNNELDEKYDDQGRKLTPPNHVMMIEPNSFEGKNLYGLPVRGKKCIVRSKRGWWPFASLFAKKTKYIGINSDLLEPLNPVVASQINGNNGSWTNSDDFEKRKFYTIDYPVFAMKKEKAGYTYLRSLQRSRPRIGEQCAYVYNHPHSPICFANTMENEEATMMTRVVCETPIPDAAFMNRFIKFAKKHFHELMNYKVCKIKPVPDEEYLRRSNATSSVKVILTKTFAILKRDNITLETLFTRKELIELTCRSLFLKQENLCYQTPLGIKEKAGRAISAADPRFICLVAPFFMALQDKWKRIWHGKNWLCFVSGVNPRDAAKLIDKPWMHVEDDIGTFDSSVCPELLEFEVWVTKQFGACESILALMRANNKTHGKTMHGAKYWCPGGRKSGDPFTSLYNSMLNAFIHVFIISETYGWSISQIKQKVRMLVAGDDNAMAIDHTEEIDFVGAMYRLGFNSEALYRDNILDVEFCSCRVYRVHGVAVFGPMPGKVLSKLGFINNPPPGVSRESLVRGIVIGLKKLCYYIPPIQHVVDRLLELTRGVEAYTGRETWTKGYEWQMDFTSFDGSVTDRISMLTCLYRTYGYTPLMDYQWSVDCKHMELDDFIDSPVFQMLCDRDTSGPKMI